MKCAIEIEQRGGTAFKEMQDEIDGVAKKLKIKIVEVGRIGIGPARSISYKIDATDKSFIKFITILSNLGYFYKVFISAQFS